MRMLAAAGRFYHLATILTLIVLLADQIFKNLILYYAGLTVNDRLVVTPFLMLVLVWNEGISYGLIPQHTPIGRSLLIAFAMAVCIFLWFWMRGSQTARMTFGLALILGGALGNLIDRALYGSVIDMFLLHIGTWSWYVFNLADVWICLGGACVVVGLWNGDDRQS